MSEASEWGEIVGESIKEALAEIDYQLEEIRQKREAIVALWSDGDFERLAEKGVLRAGLVANYRRAIEKERGFSRDR